jgi:glycosyltransferase involved in cell wall biosynthesis
MFTIKSSRKIVATILAKDEEDIIGANIEHHINQGVTHFIVTNNRSKDKTRQIVEKYPEVVEIIDEEGEDHNQSAWVTKMARMACKLDPEWIIHLDADEFWCNVSELRFVKTKCVGNTRMYLHPPRNCDFNFSKLKYYLNFEKYEKLNGECKVAHRPDPDLVITHGNHGFEESNEMSWPYTIWRHHYPVRSYDQFVRKSTDGHEALSKRGAVCDRWKKWKELNDQFMLRPVYDNVCVCWERMIKNINKTDLLTLLDFWSTPEIYNYIDKSENLATVEQWPKD